MLTAKLLGAQFLERRPRENARSFTAVYYRAGDRRLFKMAVVNTRRDWPKVCRAIGRPELASDPRYATLEDMVNFVKLAHMAPAIHFSGGSACEPMDIPPGKRHLDVQYSYFRYSDQGCEGTPETPGHAADAVRMAQVLFGPAYVDSHAVMLGNINSNSPLTFDGRMLGALREFAAHNQGEPSACPARRGGQARRRHGSPYWPPFAGRERATHKVRNGISAEASQFAFVRKRKCGPRQPHSVFP